jgi:ubiquinone biosynthesis protein UbiJ
MNEISREVSTLARLLSEQQAEIEGQREVAGRMSALIDSLRRDLEAARVVINAARAVAQHGTCSTREEIAELVVRVGSFDAARARGEALKKYAKHADDCDAIRDDIYRLRGCTCGLDALLAACEREGER